MGAKNNLMIYDEKHPDQKTEGKPSVLGKYWELILRFGLGEVTLRFGTAIATLIMVGMVIWIMGAFFLGEKITNPVGEAKAAILPTPTPKMNNPEYLIPEEGPYKNGVNRLALLHTTLPAMPRLEITFYNVLKGDTIFGISKKFNLRPETILWGNYNILADDPHRLEPGQKLNILPVDGVYYEWHKGDGLNGVADFFGVNPEDIVSFKGNHLSPDALGDYAAPNIQPGSFLIIPGGKREFVTWSAPRITRANPAVAKILGPGSCGQVMDGAIGAGSFIFPTVNHKLSGFDYSPETNHYGIDIAGAIGDQVYAVDAGVVVYSGWNDWGYGNVVVIDHGNGWQSLYAHLSEVYVQCGTSLMQGAALGGVGTTGRSSGPHLHFELRSDQYNRVNPWNFIPH